MNKHVECVRLNFKVFLFLTMLFCCVQTDIMGAAPSDEVVHQDPLDYDKKGINLFFLTTVYPSSDVLSVVQDDSAGGLMRMPALGPGVTTYDALKGILGSLKLVEEVDGRRRIRDVESGVLTCVPEECLGDSTPAVAKVYELLFKLKCYGFERLIPCVLNSLRTKHSVPSIKDLAKIFDDLPKVASTPTPSTPSAA